MIIYLNKTLSGLIWLNGNKIIVGYDTIINSALLGEANHEDAGKRLLIRAVSSIQKGLQGRLPLECQEFFLFCGLYSLSDAACINSVITLLKKFEVLEGGWEKDPLTNLVVDDNYFDVISLINNFEPGFDRRQLKRTSDETINLVYSRTCNFIIRSINEYLEVTDGGKKWNAGKFCELLGISTSKHSEWKKIKAETRKPRPYILNMLYFLLATPIWEVPILYED